MQKIGKTPGNILVKTSPQDVTLIIRSFKETIRFGDWTAVTLTHKGFQLLTNMCDNILKGKKYTNHYVNPLKSQIFWGAQYMLCQITHRFEFT